MIQFPPVDNANEEGLLCIGETLNNEILESAYRQGIFPWPVSRYSPILWFAPPMRAVLDFKDFKISSRLKQYLKKSSFTFKVDENFEAVINLKNAVEPNFSTHIIPFKWEAGASEGSEAVCFSRTI